MQNSLPQVPDLRRWVREVRFRISFQGSGSSAMLPAGQPRVAAPPLQPCTWLSAR